MSGEVLWEEPATSPIRRGKYDEFATALRDNPGKWAVFPGAYNPGLASGIKTGRYAAFRDGQFETTSRTVDGHPRLYVRYVGAP